MHISYACTFEDFAEAQKAHRTPAPGDRPSVWERLLFLWVLLGMIGLMFTVAVIEGISRGVAGSPRVATQADVSDWLLAVLVPVVL